MKHLDFRPMKQFLDILLYLYKPGSPATASLCRLVLNQLTVHEIIFQILIYVM
jgi:hypothetical protein